MISSTAYELFMISPANDLHQFFRRIKGTKAHGGDGSSPAAEYFFNVISQKELKKAKKMNFFVNLILVLG